MDPRGQAGDEALLAEVQREVDLLRRHGLTSAHDHRLTGKWSGLAHRGLAALVAPDGRLNPEALRNFRRDQILVHDLPSADLRGRPIRNRVVGWRRATRHCLLECLEILRRHGYGDLLRTYPCAPAGNPHRFDHAGYSYTFRWARHVSLATFWGAAFRKPASRDQPTSSARRRSREPSCSATISYWCPLRCLTGSLDYPIWDPGTRVHFDICPMYSVDYLFTGRAVLRYLVARPDPHFEYLGQVRGE